MFCAIWPPGINNLLPNSPFKGSLFGSDGNISGPHRHCCTYRHLENDGLVLGRLPFARKIRLEWNARNGVSPSPRLSRLEENNNKSKLRLHLQKKEAEVHWAEWEFTNGTGFFRSFRLEREKRNTSEDFHLFQKLSGGTSCTIWVSNRNFRFLLTNGKRSWWFLHLLTQPFEFYTADMSYLLSTEAPSPTEECDFNQPIYGCCWNGQGATGWNEQGCLRKLKENERLPHPTCFPWHSPLFHSNYGYRVLGVQYNLRFALQ